MIIGISGKKQFGKDTVAKIIQYLCYQKHPDIQEFEEKYRIPNVNIKNSKWQIKRFADKLKQGLAFDFPKEFNIEAWENNSNCYRDQIMLSLGITRREALQLRGQKMREINPDYWNKALFNEYNGVLTSGKGTKKGVTSHLGYLIPENEGWGKYSGTKLEYPHFRYPKFPYWLIPDVRYPNEANNIKNKNGLLIRVHRDICPKCSNNNYIHYNYITHKKEFCSKCNYVFNNNLLEHESETALDDYAKFNYIINNKTIHGLFKEVKTILINEKII